MKATPIALRFASSLLSVSAALVDELQQLVSSIRIAFADIITEIGLIEGAWADLPYAATNYTVNAGGLITVSNAAPNVFRYKLIGKTLFLNCAVTVVIGNTATAEIRFRFAAMGTAKPVTGLSGVGDLVQGAAGIYSDSAGIAGVVAVVINTAGDYVAVQRFDGAPGAVFVNGRTVMIRFMVQIPLV